MVTWLLNNFEEWPFPNRISIVSERCFYFSFRVIGPAFDYPLEPIFIGRQPASFPQERLKLNFADSISISSEWIAFLEALLEPLLEDRIDVEGAIEMLSTTSDFLPDASAIRR